MASPSNRAGFRPANLPGPMAGHQLVHARTDGRGEREVEQGDEGPEWRQDPGKLPEGEESSVNLSVRGHYAPRSPRNPGPPGPPPPTPPRPPRADPRGAGAAGRPPSASRPRYGSRCRKSNASR